MMVSVVYKPNFVTGLSFLIPANDHSSMDDGCPSPLATYPGARAGSPQSLPYLVLHRVGFTKLLRSPEELVRSYRTVSPLPLTLQSNCLMSRYQVRGGLLSVALSFTLP